MKQCIKLKHKNNALGDRSILWTTSTQNVICMNPNVPTYEPTYSTWNIKVNCSRCKAPFTWLWASNPSAMAKNQAQSRTITVHFKSGNLQCPVDEECHCLLMCVTFAPYPHWERTPSSPGSSRCSCWDLGDLNKKIHVTQTKICRLLYNELTTEKHIQEGSLLRSPSFRFVFDSLWKT